MEAFMLLILLVLVSAPIDWIYIIIGVLIWAVLCKVVMKKQMLMREKKLEELRVQLEDVAEKSEFKYIPQINKQSGIESDKNQYLFVASCVIETHKTAEEIYNYFNNFSYKSVNNVFKTEPIIDVQRIDELYEMCGNEQTNGFYCIGSKKTQAQYYLVTLTDKSYSLL